MTGKRHVFISYAHKDSGHWCDEVQRYLRITLKTLSGFEVWTDETIELAQDWDDEIRAALGRCACAVLLISDHFLDSDYIYGKELPILLCRQETDILDVIPVFMSSVPRRALSIPFRCQGSEKTVNLGSLQGPNGPGDPLSAMTDAQRKQALANLADKIAGRLEQQGPPGNRSPARGPSPPPPVSLGVPRPLLWIALDRAGGRVYRRYFFHEQAEAQEAPSTKAQTDAEYRLERWAPCYPFDGDHLYSLLFGDDEDYRQKVLAAAFGTQDPADAAPMRQPLRVRLLVEDETLMKLPWAALRYGGTLLRDSGWSVELSEPVHGGPPQALPTSSLVMPGPVLVVTCGAANSREHRDDLEGLFRTLWPRRSIFFDARDLEDLQLELAERVPRLLYYYGPGRWDTGDESYTLELPTRDGDTTELPIDELPPLLGTPGPVLCVLNLLDDQGCNALPAARTLLGRSKAVVVGCAPQQDAADAAAMGYRYLEHLLRHRTDPVTAFHHASFARGGGWTAYREWRTEADAGPDDDLVAYLLDRGEQSAMLLMDYGELVNRESALRVQLRMAIGAAGNQVRDFARQADLHLAGNPFEGSFSYQRGPIRLYPEDRRTDAVEMRFRQHFDLGPNADLFAPLHPRARDYSTALHVPLLCWLLDAGEETEPAAMSSVARALLEWARSTLAVHCPDDLRIITLLLVETDTEETVTRLKADLKGHEQALRSAEGPRPSFKLRQMKRLTGVDEDHLRDYFDSPACRCPDDLKPVYPSLLLAGREEMRFDEAVTKIRKAKNRGWRVEADALRRQQRDPGHDHGRR